ncbi:MFS transporter [Amycolatopsis sp. CA-230715]|uniref:MFS transporter n=1 Tax=Amycolatopsis sp. CA-230715 TaxID=2745196 RepID=UPI001C0188CD|nr:MFS transporter [Amycolatopsis sp. CA-230715]QWF80284.1 hypothetical protein HUW46_03703 [Amycolatopsis sp. CA-230715]
MTAVTETRPATRSPKAFAAVAAIVVLFLAASSAPSPLYVVYQRQWGFSSSVLTLVFAIYVVGLLGSLLVVGALSDHVGRRPVLASAILLEALSLGVFLVAGDVTVLCVARFLQGVATGAATTTLGATLVDLNPPHRPGRAGAVNGIAPATGLALGALGCGALVEYAPAPTHLVYAVLLAGMVIAGIVILAMPEPAQRRPGALASLRPRVGVPSHLRTEVLTVVPVLIATWALGGLYLSLGPSVAAELFGLRNHLVGGLVVTLLCGSAALSAFVLRKQPATRLLGPSAATLAAGTLVTLGGMLAGSAVLGGVGTAVAGAGFGAAMLACFGTFGRIAAPHERGKLFAVAYVIAYLAFSVPAVAAGFASAAAGLTGTAEVYGLGVAVLAGVALLARRRVPSPVG